MCKARQGRQRCGEFSSPSSYAERDRDSLSLSGFCLFKFSSFSSMFYVKCRREGEKIKKRSKKRIIYIKSETETRSDGMRERCLSSSSFSGRQHTHTAREIFLHIDFLSFLLLFSVSGR